MKKRLVALLLVLSLVLSLGISMAFATDGDPLTDPDYTAHTVLTAAANGYTFEVSGALPTGLTLEVEQLDDVYDYIRTDILKLGELPDGYTQCAYDITLRTSNGEEYPLDETVTVTVRGSDIEASSDIEVYHLADTSADDVYTAYMEDNGISTFSLTAEASAEIVPEQITDVQPEDGSFTFTTDGFSVYYVVAGTNGYSTWETNASELTNGETVTYYIEAGTTLTFISANNVTWTRTDGDGTYFTTNGSTFTVASNAPTGTTATYTFTWRNNGNNGNGGNNNSNSATLIFIVSDHNEIIKKSIAGYPVILSILDYSQNSNAYGSMPAEPGVTLNVNYRHIYQNGSNYAVQNDRTTFASTSTGIISEDIVNVLTTSTDGSSTVGIYDADGSDCEAYITGIDWSKVLTVLANLNAVKATDGTTLTTSNMGNYEVVPYVIKLMSATDVGWHIDCVVKPKTDITLSYDLNLKNYIAPGITLPSTSVGKSPLTATIGSIDGLTNNVITATYEGVTYNLTFLGWSTDVDATTATYQPGDPIKISEDTVLYAIWKDEKAQAALTIEKIFSNALASDEEVTDYIKATAGLTFTITNTSTNSSTTEHITYSESSKNWTSSELSLDPGTYTITETSGYSDVVDGFKYTQTTSTVGNVAGDRSITVTLEANETYTAVFTNSYTEDEVTIQYSVVTKSGDAVVSDVGGTVDQATENVKIYSGTAAGSTPTANDGYTFKGWFTNESCTTPVNSSWVNSNELTPEQVAGKYEEATYYALFEENEATINYEAVGPEGAMNFGTVTPTSEPLLVKTGTAEGSTAEAGTNYEFVGWFDNQGCTGEALSEDEEYIPVQGSSGLWVDGTTYYAKFLEKKATITYVAIGPEGENFGSVYLTTEDVDVVTGTAQGSTPTANPDFRFIGWYTDKDCTNAVTDAEGTLENGKFTPTKGADAVWQNVTYYAKFDYALADLIIRKSGANETLDPNQTFIFHVQGTVGTQTEGIDMRVVIQGNGSVTIKDLPVGEYTVTEETGWSWRYTAVEGTQSVVLHADGATVDFVNTRTQIYWLDGSAYSENIFGAIEKAVSTLISTLSDLFGN